MAMAGRVSQLRRHVPLILMAIGVAILLYVSVEYSRMYLEQRRLAAEWDEQQHRAANLAADAPRPANDGLTRLSINKINLNAIIVEGTSRHDLLLGPGHIKSTAQPGGVGNAVITGHRDTFFRHIYELSKGDIVTVQRDGKTYRYEVTGKRVVDPEDVSVIAPSSEHRLTLITCYPTYYIGPAPERLVVFSRMLDRDTPSSVAESSSKSATEGKQLDK